MIDNIFGEKFRLVCADGVIRENCSLTVNNGAYAFLDSNLELLEGDRAVTQSLGGNFLLTPFELAVIVNEYGPLNI